VKTQCARRVRGVSSNSKIKNFWSYGGPPTKLGSTWEEISRKGGPLRTDAESEKKKKMGYLYDGWGGRQKLNICARGPSIIGRTKKKKKTPRPRVVSANQKKKLLAGGRGQGTGGQLEKKNWVGRGGRRIHYVHPVKKLLGWKEQVASRNLKKGPKEETVQKGEGNCAKTPKRALEFFLRRKRHPRAFEQTRPETTVKKGV